MPHLNILIVQNNLPQVKSMIRFDSTHIKTINKIAPGANVKIVTNDKKIIDKHIKNAEIVIFSIFDNINFNIAPKLKWLHATSAGVTNEAYKLKGTSLLLTNSSGVHPIPIAEHVFAYMLMFTRGIDKSMRNQILKKEWKQDYDYLQVSELFGKTVAIIGYGRIGKRIAQIAKAYGMKVIAHATHKIKPDGIADAFFDQTKFGETLREADFLVNCLPLTNETKGLFDIKAFMQMKPSSYFINIGRGQTVVERDLIQALKNKTIAGAGLDVFEHEPLPEKSELWSLGNVILTSHYAGFTPKYADRVIEIFCTNFKAYLHNKPLPNLVNKEKGY